MDVAVDQAGQHEAVGKVDQAAAGGHRREAVLHRLDPAAADDDAGALARRPAGPVEQGAGVDHGDRLGARRLRLGGGGRRAELAQQGSKQQRRESKRSRETAHDGSSLERRRGR